MMSDERKYAYVDGTRCTLTQLVRRDPAWAARRIRQAEEYEAEIARLTAQLAERDAEIERLRDGLVRIIDAWDGDSESMHDDPAVIARAALAGAKT